MRTLAILALINACLNTSFQSLEPFSPVKEKLGPIINSPVSETRPYITGDGKTLYFCRRNDENNVGGTKDFMDVYRSTKSPATGEWSEPINLGKPINTRKNNAIAGTAESIDELFVLNTFNFRNIPLYTSTMSGDHWGSLQPVYVEDYYNQSKFVDIHVNQALGVMIMAVDRWEGRGHQDLFVSFKKSGNNWTAPISLGNRINTRKADFAPFLSKDGTTLFFCSYGHRTQGNADIFAARRLDDTWEKWTKPVNLGKTINSPGEEVYFSITDDYKKIYFESFSPGERNRDIVTAPLPDEVKPPEGDFDPMVIASINLEQDSTNTSITLADIQSVDLAMAEAIVVAPDNQDAAQSTLGSNPNMDEPEINHSTTNSASILPDSREPSSRTSVSENDNTHEVASTAVDINSGTEATLSPPETDPSNPLPSGTDVEQEPTNPKTESENNSTIAPEGHSQTSSSSTETFSTEILRVSEEGGAMKVRYLRNLYFELGQATISDRSKIHLDRIVELMRADATLNVTLSGHSDITGSEKSNLRLSLTRAKSAANYLTAQGIAEARISVGGFGTRTPLASNDDEVEGREYNRRVEILLESVE